jgi:hypothetical protein
MLNIQCSMLNVQCSMLNGEWQTAKRTIRAVLRWALGIEH